MDISTIKVGTKFHDPRLSSQPPHYRVHVVRAVVKASNLFVAEHIASGTLRDFSLESSVVHGLVMVNSLTVIVDLDDLIGEKVKLELTDGGRLSGRVTAILYRSFDIPDILEPTGLRTVREIASIEIDRSGATSYPLKDIAKIIRL